MIPKRLLPLALCAVSSCFAGSIPVTSVTASDYLNAYYLPEHLIDGSGLSAGLHDNYFGNMWLCYYVNTPTATLDFDLGGLYTLDNTFVWNYNWDAMLDRGTETLTILTSADGINYSTVGDFSLTQGTGAPISADTLSLGGTLARYVRFNLTSNYGDSSYMGLSEVQFDGNASSLPEPASAILVLTGLAGGALWRLRRRPSR
ncbi:MAG: discoidin domain-containing protein [Bryobacteraceae bacterium]